MYIEQFCVQTSIDLLFYFLGIEPCRPFYFTDDGDSVAGKWEACSQRKLNRVHIAMCTSRLNDHSVYRVDPNIFSQVSVLKMCFILWLVH